MPSFIGDLPEVQCSRLANLVNRPAFAGATDFQVAFDSFRGKNENDSRRVHLALYQWNFGAESRLRLTNNKIMAVILERPYSLSFICSLICAPDRSSSALKSSSGRAMLGFLSEPLYLVLHRTLLPPEAGEDERFESTIGY